MRWSIPFLSQSQSQTEGRAFLAGESRPATAHHDALEFPDGEIVLLTELREGQHVTVLQLPDAQADHRARLNDMAMRRSFGRAGWLHGQDGSPGTRSMSTGADVGRAPFRTASFYDGIEAVRQDAQTAAA